VSELKRYLLRSVCDWALDEGLTPHILVDATFSGARVPERYVENGRIVFNVHPRAVHLFEITDTGLGFSARFGGQPMQVFVPLPAVLAVYAKENGQGISFPEPATTGPEGQPPEPAPEGEPPRPKGAHLRVVK
jgi:stringent starvation protein B